MNHYWMNLLNMPSKPLRIPRAANTLINQIFCLIIKKGAKAGLKGAKYQEKDDLNACKNKQGAAGVCAAYQ